MTQLPAAHLHPARQMDFTSLAAGLQDACDQSMVYQRHDQATGRTLYCYTKRCVYDGAWNEFSVLARGLIVDHAQSRVVATPFPKFFNAGEQGRGIPDMPFEAFEKVDGSLIIIHHHVGRWLTATKGDFGSSQAAWAKARLDAQDTSALVPGTTYLAEAVYSDNRIVVRYDHEGLVLLAAYDEMGVELDYASIQATASAMGWRHAARQSYGSVEEMMEAVQGLGPDEEGYVLRFADGTRLKVKGAEYCRLHALISRCTPLGVWDMMAAGSDLDAVRRDVPEEFWADFDAIRGLLEEAVVARRAGIAQAAAAVAHLSDKELGMGMDGGLVPQGMRGYVFTYRRNPELSGEKTRQTILRDVRPSGDVLPGYQPSYALDRVSDDG
jgi:RNA ligase